MPALYKRHALCLWVEDSLTRSYLKSCWADTPELGILVSGGKAGTRAVTELAWRDQHFWVFGLVDRDFGTSNVHQWKNPPKDLRCYTTEVYELENHLLDFQALAACEYNTRQREAEEIETHLREHAAKSAWWMACRATLAEVQTELCGRFPHAPKQADVSTLETATRALLESEWWYSERPTSVERWTSAYLIQRLESHYAAYEAKFSSNDWKATFSGKELFQTACQYISQEGLNAARREDVAKSLGRHQRQEQRIPPELHHLKHSVLGREKNPVLLP